MGSATATQRINLIHLLPTLSTFHTHAHRFNKQALEDLGWMLAQGFAAGSGGISCRGAADFAAGGSSSSDDDEEEEDEEEEEGGSGDEGGSGRKQPRAKRRRLQQHQQPRQPGQQPAWPHAWRVCYR